MSHKKSHSAHVVTGAFAMLLALGFIGIFALVYPKPTVSEIEKRPLATRPVFSTQALITGDYTRELSNYFADTFPLREQLVAFSGKLTEMRGVRFDDVRIHEAKADDGAISPDVPPLVPDEEVVDLPPVSAGESEAPSSSAPISSSQAEEGVVEDGVRNGSIFIYKNNGYQIFGGGDSMGQWYAQTINRYEREIGQTVRIFNLVVPSSIEFGLPDRYKSITSPQAPKLENIRQSLDAGVEFINPHAALSEHKEEYLYFGTDHHWTTLGAYYAYTAFCQTAQFEPVNFSSLEKRTLQPFLGTLYSQTQDPGMAANPDAVDYYMMPTPVTCDYFLRGSPFHSIRGPLYGEYAKSYNSYSVFLQGDMPIIRINSDLTNGRRLAVVKESFGNALVPWLVNHYEKVLVIDQRYLERGFYQLLQEEGINELLFVNNIFAAHTPVRIRELETLPNRVYIPPVETSSQDAVAQPAQSEPAVVIQLPNS